MEEKERIFILDWRGMMGHFRQMDTNSSSLSYSFPPPTTIVGMLAGVMGKNRDSYYEEFNSQNLKLAIELKRTPRKILQTTNYMFVKTKNDYTGQSGRTQIPFEMVVSESFPRSFLWYRIFFYVKNSGLLSEFRRHWKNPTTVYPPAMGNANFASFLEYLSAEEVQRIPPGTEGTFVHSVVDVDILCPNTLRLASDRPLAYLKERMRREFGLNREPGKMVELLWEKNAQQIHAGFQEPIYKIKVAQSWTQVVFF
ncbi:MAG: CRISPR-associated protein Cas5 [Planctomycetota bacterium]|nr:MAG: CRISPR-associated protein Cas5 [Planctomycetota bacterium]